MPVPKIFLIDDTYDIDRDLKNVHASMKLQQIYRHTT